VSVRALAGLVVVALLAWLGFRFVADRVRGADCPRGTVTVNIAAAPDIAPALADAAGSLHGTDRYAGDYCYTAKVSPAEPARVAATLAGRSGDTRPDVWVPDSSYWLTRVRADGGDAVPRSATSVASSPVVIALAEPVARTLGWPNAKVSWSRLLDSRAAGRGLRIGIPDPARSPVGVSALLAVRKVTAPDGRPSAATVAAVRMLSANVSALPGDLFGKLPQAADPVSVGKALGGFPATEQSVSAYDGGHPVVPAVAVYPQPASPSLDYPYVVGAGLSEAVAAAAGKFLAVLRSPDAVRGLTAAGFRTPGGGTGPGFPSAAGIDTDIVPPVPLPDGAALAQTVGMWSTITLPSRLLAVVDVSGSMGDPVPGTNQNRLQLTLSAALQGLGLYSDDSEIGLWTFSTNLDGARDYRELVPIGPLSAQRAALASAIARIQVKQGGATGLYDTVLAAYQRISREWDPVRSNALLVFTDGQNEDPQGISRATLLRELKTLYNRNRPVRIVFIGLGPDVSAEELSSIAGITHGLAVVTRDPGGIRDIFLQALAVRPCQPPNC
jgi:Ca-activated chloride channel homolog